MYFLHHIRGGKINSVLLVIMEVVLVLVPTIYSPRKLISVQKVMMGIFGRLIVITYNTLWRHHLLGVIQIILQVILHLMFQLVIIKVVWVLELPNFPPIKIIVCLMVIIFVSSRSIYYLAMFYSKKDKYFSSLSMRWYDKFSPSGDDIGGVGLRITHFSSQKVDFGTDRYNGRFHPSHHHCTSSPMVS